MFMYCCQCRYLRTNKVYYAYNDNDNDCSAYADCAYAHQKWSSFMLTRIMLALTKDSDCILSRRLHNMPCLDTSVRTQS